MEKKVELEKLKSLEELQEIIRELQAGGKIIVFTNGCFDILHLGHIQYLRQAAALGDVLVVAVNSDESVRRLKGAGRPIQPDRERAEILGALEMVGFVTIFEEDTPLTVIRALLPDVLVKGGDWSVETIVGRDEVEAAGGTVHSLPFSNGFSTTDLVKRIIKARHK